VKKYNIAIVGATGNVGRNLLDVLHERKFPVDKVFALASKDSVGKEVSFGDVKRLRVEAVDDFDFSQVDIVLSSAGGAVAEKFAPKAAAAGAVVIDNSSHFRMDKDVPLIIPEVNGDDLEGFSERNIIANPNCSTIQMLLALKPLHDLATIKRVVVSTYQSVSGGGKSAMDELYKQTKSCYESERSKASVFSKAIAFNCIPHIDVFMDNGETKEEWKMAVETKKILGEDIPVTATCVRVPAFIGHGEAINIEFENEISDEEAHVALDNFEGVTVMDRRQDGGYMTQAEIAGEDDVYISRIRRDESVEHGLNLWCMADNMRKGAALNAVQIAEELIIRKLL